MPPRSREIQSSKEPVAHLDASPSKRIYHSIIADYDLNRSICELVDNALDVWRRNDDAAVLVVRVDLDATQQSIRIEDNAGGILLENLEVIVSPGESLNDADDDSIGYFGVGSKRAAVALAMLITITTRAKRQPGHRVTYDEEWLTTEDDWDLPVFRADAAPEGRTIIELNKLRTAVSEEDIERLRRHLAATYGRLIDAEQFSLIVNDVSVEGRNFEVWAYPPRHEPQPVIIAVTADPGPVHVRILAGLMTEARPGEGEYGVYVYCNNRLVAQALKTHEVGFVSGQAGKPHPSASLMRVILSFEGPAGSMPWNSSKSDLNTQHPTFRSIQPNLVTIAAHWATLSRRLAGKWTTHVGPYAIGAIKDAVIQQPGKTTRSYLPKLPRKRAPPYADVTRRANLALRRDAPWLGGIIDSMIAVDLILNQRRMEQRHRVAFLLLDSTLEIAFKEYLVSDSGQSYRDGDLLNLFKNRSTVQAEFAKYVSLSTAEKKQIEHFYKIRCKLVHERASVGISEEQVSAYRNTVTRILKRAFGLKL